MEKIGKNTPLPDDAEDIKFPTEISNDNTLQTRTENESPWNRADAVDINFPIRSTKDKPPVQFFNTVGHGYTNSIEDEVKRSLDTGEDVEVSLESDSETLYPFTAEGLDRIDVLIDEFASKATSHHESLEKNKTITGQDEKLYESIRSHLVDARDLIRGLRDLTENEDNEFVESRAHEFVECIYQLNEKIDNFLENNRSEEEDIRRAGWWDPKSKVREGISPTVVVGELKQVWGDQSKSIGFEPEKPEIVENNNRTGWWDKEFQAERGISPTVVEGELKQVWVDQSKSIGLDTEKSESEPKNYEEIRKAWVEARALHEDKHEEYLAAVDQYYSDWAKEVEAKGFLDKNLTKIRTKFGFKPDLPKEIIDIRDEAFAASETYNQYAREMAESRALNGQKNRDEVSPEVLDRYNQLLARKILLNTFSSQVESQKKAVESLGFKPNKFVSYLSKNKTYIKLLGVVVLGVATGGLAGLAAEGLAGLVAGGGALWARSIAGGAMAAGVDRFANELIRNWSESRQKAEVSGLVAKINDKSLSKQEINEQYERLEEILSKVDELNRLKILAIVGSAALASSGVGAAMEHLAGTAESLEGAASAAAPAGAESDRIVIDVGAESDAVTDVAQSTTSAEFIAGAEAANPQTIATESELPVTSATPGASEVVAAQEPKYTAESGDNLWNIMEGQTEAGNPAYLEHVSEADKQRIIALVVERVNEDAALRSELGFGETADNLQIGAEVDIERLNALAEEIAKEEGLYQAEVPTESAEPESTSGTPEVVSATSPAAAETLFMNSVNQNSIIEYARGYEGGYVKFESDFNKIFVEGIQGPTPADSLFNRIFGGPPASADAFKIFGPYSIAEFNELAKADEVELSRALGEEQIDVEDYMAWRDALAQWQEDGLVVNSNSRFSEVAEAAFINSINQPKAA